MKFPPLIVLLASFLTGCEAVYLPNIHSSTFFSKKREVQGTAAIGINGVDLQAAAAITNHIAVTGGYAYLDRSVSPLPYSTHALYYEGALGYYKNFTKTCVEIFGGYGAGEGNSHTQDPGPGLGTSQMPSGLVSGAYDKIFIQPSVALKVHMTQFGFSFRISSVNFTQFTYINKPLTPIRVLYLEPAVTSKINFRNKHAFCFFQIGLNIPPPGGNLPWESAERYARNFQLAGGVGFRLGGN